jgi:hypothetical protein
MPFTCWSCEEELKTKDELRNHYMRLPHRFLEVVCAWCTTKTLFRRPVDLRMHMKERHRDIQREQGKDFPADEEAFFLATKPRAYLNSISGQPSDGQRVRVLKEAVLGNSSIGSAEVWQKGWDRHGPVTGMYSPTKPSLWTIESLSLDPEGGRVIVSGGVGEILRLTIPCQDHHIRDSLLRMMATVKPGMELPNSWTSCTRTDSSTILAAVGLPSMKVGKVEKNAWSPKEPPQKRQRTVAPPSPLTPLASPQHQLELEEPPYSPRVGFQSPPSIVRQTTPPTTQISTCYIPTPKGDAASALPSPAPPSTCAGSITIDQGCPEKRSIQTVVEQTPSSDLVSRALPLLLAGGMPLFPPARRNWTGESTLKLPLQGSFQTWPPAGWQQMSPDTRLLLWETVSTTLAVQFNMALDRQSILDSFQFLALPGSKDPSTATTESRMRHGNFSILRKISLGKQVVAAETLLSMFEVGHQSSHSSRPGEYRDLIVLASTIPLRL